MKYLVYLIVISLTIVSCKKDKLLGEKSIFIGKWEWFKSDHIYNICSGTSVEETITLVSEGNTYLLEFLEKGIVNFYENDNYLEKNRIVFSQFSGEYCNIPFDDYLRFSIYLNNDSEDFSKKMDGCISKDTLILIRGFPYYDDPNGCESYVNYFVKQ